MQNPRPEVCNEPGGADEKIRPASKQPSGSRTATIAALDAVLLDVTGQPEIKLAGTDANTLGMAFDCSRKLREGERIAVKFRLMSGAIKLIICRTRYCRATETGSFHAGVEFFNAVLPTGIASPNR